MSALLLKRKLIIKFKINAINFLTLKFVALWFLFCFTFLRFSHPHPSPSLFLVSRCPPARLRLVFGLVENLKINDGKHMAGRQARFQTLENFFFQKKFQKPFASQFVTINYTRKNNFGVRQPKTNIKMDAVNHLRFCPSDQMMTI